MTAAYRHRLVVPALALSLALLVPCVASSATITIVNADGAIYVGDTENHRVWVVRKR